MIISKKKYEEMIDCLREAQKAINRLQKENDCLKTILKKTNLSSIYGMTAANIDFPATEKLHEDTLFF